MKTLLFSAIAASSNPDNDSKGLWRSGDFRSPSYRQTLCYDIVTPSGKTIAPPTNGWRWSETEVKRKIQSGEILFNEDETRITRKIYLCNQDGRTPENVWSDDSSGTTRQANAEIKEIFKDFTVFDTPKPTKLIQKICQLFYNEKDFICLDFFSGSATTAHAVMQLNAEDRGDRKFIMVQIPEVCDEKSEAFKAGYKTIAEIGKERIRRAGARIKDELEMRKDGGKVEGGKDSSSIPSPSSLDVGFRVLKIDSSNMNDVYYAPDDVNQDLLSLMEKNIKDDRTAEDLLFHVLLDWGLDLSAKIVKEEIQGKAVYFVNDDDLVACFDDGVDEALVKALAKRKVMRVVFKDTGFAKDEIKDNVEQIFKQLSPETEVRAI